MPFWSVSKNYGVNFSENNKSVHLSWSRSNFSDFCIDLLSALEGLPYNDKNRPSFGQIFDHIKRKHTPVQGETNEKGKPFLCLKLYEGGEHGEKFKIDCNAVEPTINFRVCVENQGDTAAIISDDSFKSQCELDAGKVAVRPVSLKAIHHDKDGNLIDILKDKPFESQYRLVYYPVNTEKEFCVIEQNVRITDSDVEFVESEGKG